MLRMKELIEQSNETKSTILYYLKEELLIPPKKIKSNLYLYPKENIYIIKFIKYLQSLNYSISQIKEIFNKISLKKGFSFYTMVKALEVATISKGKKLLSKEEFLKKANISEEELNNYIKKGYLLDKKSEFGENEVEVINIIKKASKLDLEDKIIKPYVKFAQNVASIENRNWGEIFEDSAKDTIKEYELLFDIILKLKPYIFNIYTIKEYYNLKGLENEKVI